MRLFRPQPRISLATSSEASPLAGLYSRAWETHRGNLDQRLINDQTPDAEEVTAWLKGGFEVFVAALDGELVGVVRCSFPTGTCMVDRMAVDPQRANRGIGRALAEHAITRARRAGVTKIWVQVPIRLEEVARLYRSLGFKESGRLTADYWGEELVLMELPL